MGFIKKVAAAGAVAAVGAIAANREAVKKAVRGLLHKTEDAAGQLAQRAESALAPTGTEVAKPAAKVRSTATAAGKAAVDKVTKTARKAKGTATKAKSTVTAAARKATATASKVVRTAR